MTNQTTQPFDDHHQRGATSRHRRTLLWTATLALLLVGGGAQAQPQRSAPPELASLSAAAGSQACSASRATRLHQGKTARNRMKAIEKGRSKEFRKAKKWLRSMGYEPTELFYSAVTEVVYTSPADQLSCHPGSNQTDTVAGTLSVWSWDDSDDSTWEGILHLADEESGISGLFAVQLSFGENSMSFGPARLFDLSDGSSSEVEMGGTLPVFSILGCKVGFNWRTFYRDAAAGCAVVGAACLLAGPAAPECFAVGCSGALLLGFLDGLDFDCD